MTHKFRFVIASLFTGDVQGTDDEEIAMECSHVEEDFVIDTHTGEHILYGEREPIEEVKSVATEPLPADPFAEDEDEEDQDN